MTESSRHRQSTPAEQTVAHRSPSPPVDESRAGQADAGLRRDLDEWRGSADDGVTVERRGPAAGSPVDSVLVPVADGPYSYFAASLGARLAERRSASVELLTVVLTTAGRTERMQADARLNNFASEFDDVPVDCDVVVDDDVAATLADRARDHGVVCIGGSDRSLFRRVLWGTVPDRLADRSDVLVLVVRGDATG